jgi:hypothetical protein
MTDVPESAFLHIYGEFLLKAWANPPLKNKFMKEPEAVLKAYGLDPEGAKVLVMKPNPNTPPDQAKPERQAQLWNEGKKKGRIEFYFPEQPPPEFASAELTDDDLMAIAGGVVTKYCCSSSCTPCCCC